MTTEPAFAAFGANILETDDPAEKNEKSMLLKIKIIQNQHLVILVIESDTLACRSFTCQWNKLFDRERSLFKDS